jgi:putative colanic acid biosynthesis UDP-glucose lipid carrier transferase
MEAAAPSPEKNISNKLGIGSDFPRYAEIRVLISAVLRVADAAILVASSIFTFWMRNDSLDLPTSYLIATCLSIVLLFTVGQVANLYRFETITRFPLQLGAASLSMSTVMATLAVVGYFTKTAEIFSRLWLFTWFFIAYAGIVIIRVVIVRRLEAWRASGGFRRRLAVVGAGEKGARLIRHLQTIPEANIALVGVFDNEAIVSEIEGIPLRGNVHDLIRNAHQLDLDEIIVALPGNAHEILSQVMGELRTVPADVSLCPDTIGLTMPILGVEVVNGLGLLRIYRRPISGWDRLTKAIEDRLLAVFFLILFSPILLLIALAIKLDSKGPIFFSQPRSGFNNNSFVLYKFRTMHESAQDDLYVTQAQRIDPRITRVGTFLRRASLDEFPQLINVLKGEMSLVGPRPHAIAHNAHYANLIDQYLGRHRVKPGMTGWAQVHGYRGETETVEKMRARVEYDLYYIDHWSLWFDLRILFMTPFVGLVNRNAY